MSQLNSSAATLRYRPNHDDNNEEHEFELKELEIVDRKLTVDALSQRNQEITTLMPVPKTWRSFLYNLIFIPMLYGTAQGLGSAVASYILFRMGWRQSPFALPMPVRRN